MRPQHRRSVLLAVPILAAGLLLSACAGAGDADAGPEVDETAETAPRPDPAAVQAALTELVQEGGVPQGFLLGAFEGLDDATVDLSTELLPGLTAADMLQARASATYISEHWTTGGGPQVMIIIEMQRWEGPSTTAYAVDAWESSTAESTTYEDAALGTAGGYDPESARPRTDLPEGTVERGMWTRYPGDITMRGFAAYAADDAYVLLVTALAGDDAQDLMHATLDGMLPSIVSGFEGLAERDFPTV